MKCLAIATTLLATTALFAQSDDVISADRPGLADSSTVVGKGTAQVEVGVERDRTSDAGVEETSVITPLLLRYGLTPNIELRVESDGFQSTHSRINGDTERDHGVSPLAAGFKWNFPPPANTHRPSIGIIGGLSFPSGSGNAKSDHWSEDLRLVADIELNERWSLNPNVGIAHDVDDDGHDFTAALAALTVAYQVSGSVQTFVDFGLQAPESKGGNTSLQFDGGFAWIIGRDTQLDFSFGPGVSGHTTPDFFWSAGISRRFR